MGLLPIDIQTQSKKKLFSIFRYSFSFFLTDLILFDLANRNMDRYGILRHFRKWAYFPLISKPGVKKNYFFTIFRYYSLFFLTDSISTPRTKKSTTQAVKKTRTSRVARTKRSTTQMLFASESFFSGSEFLSSASLHPALRAELCFVRGVDIIQSSRQKYG